MRSPAQDRLHQARQPVGTVTSRASTPAFAMSCIGFSTDTFARVAKVDLFVNERARSIHRTYGGKENDERLNIVEE
jgi:hypothetical protein